LTLIRVIFSVSMDHQQTPSGTHLVRLLTLMLLLIDRQYALTFQSPSGSFRPVYFANGTATCDSSSPSSSISVSALVSFCPVNNGVPGAVCCAYSCTALIVSGNNNCVGFNYRSDFDQCDFYTSTITNCAIHTGCAYYSVGGASLTLFILSGLVKVVKVIKVWVNDRVAYKIICNYSPRVRRRSPPPPFVKVPNR